MAHSHEHEITNENEQKTLIVIILTLVAMLAEIAYGYITHSMALLADGYHMGTHFLALSLTYAAYILMRKLKDSALFPSGTDKIGFLAAYTSSIFLGLTGLWIVVEAFERLVNPVKIQFNEAILVAIIGLVVNLVCIFVMERGKSIHEHKDCHGCENCNKCDKTEDYNFMSAYYHILADALTSVLAITALIVGKFLNIVCLDAFVGIIGAFMILKWAINLLKKTTVVLIDMKKD